MTTTLQSPRVVNSNTLNLIPQIGNCYQSRLYFSFTLHIHKGLNPAHSISYMFIRETRISLCPQIPQWPMPLHCTSDSFSSASPQIFSSLLPSHIPFLEAVMILKRHKSSPCTALIKMYPDIHISPRNILEPCHLVLSVLPILESSKFLSTGCCHHPHLSWSTLHATQVYLTS